MNACLLRSGHDTDQSPAQVLATPVQFLKGVGSENAQRLARLDIVTARDVLFLFPRDYQDLSDLRTIADLEEGLLLSVRGTVEDVDVQQGRGRPRLGVLIQQGGEYLRATWFNQLYLYEKFSPGQHVLFSGKARFHGGRWEMTHPRVAWLEDEHDQPSTSILPVYPLTEGIPQYRLRKIVRGAVEQYTGILSEVFSPELLSEHGLMPLARALPEIHGPTDQPSLEQARRRFIFQELYILQLAIALRRWKLDQNRHASPLEATTKIDARIRRLFPFELTADQQQAIREVADDMGRTCPMNRLLHGEVGSGKTVIAVYAMLLCVAHGRQAVLMTPTEVLARQHAQTLGDYLRAGRVRTALLTGSLTQRERSDTLSAIAAGEIDLVIGTQAIVQDDVKFARLGLAVIDEQHKFGVLQRAQLRKSGVDPHYLVMTATPIPRTVGMTLFGDLDVSTIRQSPPGRQPVNTYLVEPDRYRKWWDFVCKKLNEGRQAYVIAPLVDENENLAVASVESLFEELSNGQLEAFRLGLLHGRMSAQEKQDTMQAFRSGQTQVLVATSIVEVGIDVANATVMTILSAQRFGLAQLHQLRGRVSRGKHAGYCGLVAEESTEQAQERLEAMVETTDGFRLAEVDFQQRGPGDLMGTQQHGLPPLRIANLQRDQAILEEARTAAQKLLAIDPGLADPDHVRLRQMALIRYGRALDLGDVG